MFARKVVGGVVLISIHYIKSTCVRSQQRLFAGSTLKLEIYSGNDMADQCILRPPSEVRGMKVLDRSLFSKSVIVPWIALPPGFDSSVSLCTKCLKKYMLKLERLKPIQNVDVPSDDKAGNLKSAQSTLGISFNFGGNQSLKRVLLNPLLVNTFEDIDERDRVFLEKFGISKEQFNSGEVRLSYENWKADEILKSVIPSDTGNLTSFSKIGHIVHVNLKENLLEYKSVIGKVLLDKVPGARTVVNKTDAIDNTYRNFQMELLCGENDMKVEVRENRCVFEFDFSCVYWNPRLCTEHERILSTLSPGDTLFDVFAGVGPFSIPAARYRRCALVLANDLNPDSYRWLVHNSSRNKVSPAIFQAFNKDGWSFILEDVAAAIEKRWTEAAESSSEVEGRMHVVMNLPGRAPEFLAAFCSLFAGKECFREVADKDPITVHVYCFASVENSQAEAIALVENNIRIKLTSKEVAFVRKVSPSKEMLRVTFKLPKEVLFINVGEQLPLPHAKRICIESALDSEEREDGEAENKTAENEAAAEADGKQQDSRSVQSSRS